jgi:hypothetical protein
LRLNQETDRQFWGQTGRNHRHQFWGQTRENHRHWFWGQILETVTIGFEAKPLETVATGFDAKPTKIVWVILRPNHSQTIAIGFEVQTDEKPSQWFWGQTTDKLSTLHY